MPNKRGRESVPFCHCQFAQKLEFRICFKNLKELFIGRLSIQKLQMISRRVWNRNCCQSSIWREKFDHVPPKLLSILAIGIANYLGIYRRFAVKSDPTLNCKLSRNLPKIQICPKKSGSKGVQNCYPFIPKNSNTRTVSDHECTDWL